MSKHNHTEPEKAPESPKPFVWVKDPPKAGEHRDTREESGGVTVYSCGGVDLVAHKKGDRHYKCLSGIPAQGLYAGHTYELSPPNFEESLRHVVANFKASLPAEPAK